MHTDTLIYVNIHVHTHTDMHTYRHTDTKTYIYIQTCKLQTMYNYIPVYSDLFCPLLLKKVSLSE